MQILRKDKCVYFLYEVFMGSMFFIPWWLLLYLSIEKPFDNIKNLYLSCIMVMMLFSCNGKATKSADTEVSSDLVATIENAEQANAAKIFILTEEGVGSLKMMQPFNDMSKSDEGLYNKVTKESYVDESGGVTLYDYMLYMDEEMVAGFTLSVEKAPIVMLHVYSPRVLMENGVKTGTLLRDFLGKGGVEANAEGDIMGDSGVGYSAWISLGKICVYGWWSSEDILTERGRAKATSAEMGNPTILFPEDIKPGAEISDICVYRKDE